MHVVLGTLVAVALIAAVAYLFWTRPSSSSAPSAFAPSSGSSSSGGGDQGLRIAGAALAGVGSTLAALGAGTGGQ